MTRHRLAAYRAEHQLSLAEVAARLRELSRTVNGIDSGPTTRTVWGWDHGVMPRRYWRRLLCRLYGATAEQLGFTERTPAAARGHVEPLLSVEPPQRTLLDAIATVAAASGGLECGERVGDRRLGLADVARLDAVTTLYRSFDYEHGGVLVYEEVGRFAERASAMLDHRGSDAVRGPLLSAVAAARQLAGWTAFDAGQHSDAQRHWLSAERAALGACDKPLAARVRYSQARQFQHRAHNRDALETLQLAREQLGADATPAVLAMLWGAEAASLAALGDRRAALAALARARDQHERIDLDREPDWTRAFGVHGELLAQHGRVYRDLARADRRHGDAAVRWVSEAIDAFPSALVRSRVFNKIGLCSALFLAGAPEDALVLGNDVLDRARTVPSARVQDRLRGVCRDLDPYRGRADVAEFAHRLVGA